MSPDVELTVEDGIGWLTMRRPRTRNAMDPEIMEAAVAALDNLPDGREVRAAAQRLAAEVAGAAPAALLATRRLVDAAPGHSFGEHLDDETRSILGLVGKPNFAEGVAAFLERRPPRFTAG